MKFHWVWGVWAFGAFGGFGFRDVSGGCWGDCPWPVCSVLALRAQRKESHARPAPETAGPGAVNFTFKTLGQHAAMRVQGFRVDGLEVQGLAMRGLSVLFLDVSLERDLGGFLVCWIRSFLLVWEESCKGSAS